MSEESVLRYRLEVVRLMPEGAYKNALIEGINTSLAELCADRGTVSKPRHATLLDWTPASLSGALRRQA